MITLAVTADDLNNNGTAELLHYLSYILVYYLLQVTSYVREDDGEQRSIISNAASTRYPPLKDTSPFLAGLISRCFCASISSIAQRLYHRARGRGTLSFVLQVVTR